MADAVALLTAENQALYAELAKLVPDFDPGKVRAAAADDKDDYNLILEVAKHLDAKAEEVAKRRQADPDWWREILAKYGLDGGKGKEG